MKKNPFSNFFIPVLACMILIVGLSFDCPAADEQKTIAILPFEMISAEEISYIQSGILKMLHSRLVWKDHVAVVPQKAVSAHLAAVEGKNYPLTIKKIADLTGSDYVLAGTITQFSNAFSIDSKIYDIQNSRFMIFSDQSDKIDDVIPKLNAIAAKINKKVFDRKTIAYENLAKEEKEKAEQWKRQNPEKMMPAIPGGQEEKSSPWKFWQYL